MPQVPLLTPEVAPTTGGVPEIQLGVPTDAFGGAVGQALKSVGADVEGASNQIWQRAVQMQDLRNRTEVDKADADFMEKAGLVHAQFSAKLGEERAAAYPKYIQDLKDIRDQIKGGLSNQMSQRMFDTTSLSTLGRTIFNGAGVAAEGAKVAAMDAATNRLKTKVSQAAVTEDPVQFEGLRKEVLAQNNVVQHLKGTPDSIPDTEFVLNSSLDSNRVIHLAKTDPFAAKEKLDELVAKKQISGDDYKVAENIITAQRRAIGSANIANEVWDQGRGSATKPEISEDAMIELGRKQAKEDAPDDPIFIQHVEAAIHSKYTREKQAQRQLSWDSKQDIAVAIQNGAATTQELLTDPRAAAAYHSLTPREQLQVPGQIERYIKSRDAYDNQRSMTTLDGMRKNDVLGFLDIDPTDPKYKLSQPQIRTVMGWKDELRQNQNQDPQVNRAMGQLRGAMAPQLQALGIYHRDAHNPEDYDHFTGALSEAIRTWQDVHGKPPDPRDITDTIAPQLLRQHQVPGMIWGTNTSDPLFKEELGTKQFKDFREQHIKSRVDQGQPEPTQQETERLFYRGLAKTLYGSASGPPAPKLPTIPVNQ